MEQVDHLTDESKQARAEPRSGDRIALEAAVDEGSVDPELLGLARDVLLEDQGEQREVQLHQFGLSRVEERGEHLLLVVRGEKLVQADVAQGVFVALGVGGPVEGEVEEHDQQVLLDVGVVALEREVVEYRGELVQEWREVQVIRLVFRGHIRHNPNKLRVPAPVPDKPLVLRAGVSRGHDVADVCKGGFIESRPRPEMRAGLRRRVVLGMHLE